MDTDRERSLNLLACVGLGLGAVFGMAGTFVSDENLRSLFWGIDGAGLVMAAALLTLKYFRRGNDIVAAGFLVFAIGEGLLIGGLGAGLEGGIPAFAAGTALWATALLLISAPKEFATWVRLAGLAGAAAFATVSIRILSGEQLTAISMPMPFFAYPFLVLSFAGWMWTLLRRGG